MTRMLQRARRLVAVVLAGFGLLHLAGCATPSPETSCRLTYVTELPLTGGRDQFFTTVQINGQDAKLLFDTGSFDNVLTAPASQRLGMHMTDARGMISGVGGTARIAMAIASSVRIGRLRGNYLRFSTIEAPPDPFRRNPDGVLGMNFLYDFNMDLDLLGRKVVFFKAAGLCSRPTVTLAGHLFTMPLVASRQGLSPTIEVAIGLRTFKAAIDTGAQRSVLFSTASAQLGLESAARHGTDGHALRGFGSASIPSYRHVIDRLDVGDATVLNLPVQVADQPRIGDVDMLLGADFLERVHVWISHSSRTLVIESPPLISAPTMFKP